MKHVKIAYIGGGSKQWARVFMNDLALADGICGDIALYDIDIPAAERNKKIGERINAAPECVSRWNYSVCERISDALDGADIVIASILPGTFDEMASDVHAPEKYGVYQSVGDTAGPGGVLRAMRTVPLYEGFARAVRENCPDAWVINLTNPMSICVKTLYDVFPEVKAFGCCHEVFHAQEFLSCVAAEQLGVPRPDRHEIKTDASGVNHFTWITEARWHEQDLFSLLPDFIDRFYDSGYCEQGNDPRDFKSSPFRHGNRVKMDLFKRYGVLGAAGDRHLVEFMNNSWYLRDPETVDKWMFHLTSVEYRRRDQAEKIAASIAMASGETVVSPTRSNEEAVELIKAILGFGSVVSNVNMPNIGQMPDMPLGTVVETNCVFDLDSVRPIVANRLPCAVNKLVYRAAMNIENTYSGIKHRDFDEIFEAFVDQPLVSSLSIDEARALFGEMISNTRAYLDEFYGAEKIDEYQRSRIVHKR